MLSETSYTANNLSQKVNEDAKWKAVGRMSSQHPVCRKSTTLIVVQVFAVFLRSTTE